MIVLPALPQTCQVILDKEIRETLAFLKLGTSNSPPVTLSNLFHILNICLSPHNTLSKEILQLQSHDAKREIRELQWHVCMHMMQSLITQPWPPKGPLPHSVHKTACAHKMSNHAVFLLLLIIKYMSPCLIFCTPSKPCTEYVIIHFLMSFSLVLFFYSILLINRN